MCGGFFKTNNRVINRFQVGPTRTEPGPSGTGYVTRSSLRIRLGPEQRTRLVTCKATSPDLGDVKTESLLLNAICKFLLPLFLIAKSD